MPHPTDWQETTLGTFSVSNFKNVGKDYAFNRPLSKLGVL